MITFGFFDSVDGDRKYSADDISNFFEMLIPDGVMAEPENTLQVCESSGLTVKVLPGWGFIGRKWIHNDAELFLTLDQPDIILNRADRVVVRLNRTLRTMEIALKRGTPGETPAIPALQRDENIWEISLAYIMVWGGRTEIYQNDIGDERWNSDVCGRILGFDKVGQILNRLSVLEDDCYHCNSVNDNITLPAYIYDWKQSHSGKVLKIVGNFGVSDDTSEVDEAAYSMVYRNPDTVEVVLDFADCGIITAKSHQFAYFRNCTVRNLMLNYPDLSLSEASAMQNLIDIRDAALENCHIYGSLDGCEAGVTCYHMLGGRLINCKAEFSSDNMLWGIMSGSDAAVSGCSISVSGTSEETAAGISALNSHVSDSKFTAEGKTAYGGLAGGNFTNCIFTGIGELNGYGFGVSSSLHASECSFKGYTADSENGAGIGISAGIHAKLLLHGITCPNDLLHNYEQTSSLTAAEGCQGYYDGLLYTPPVLPANDTVVTYTDFLPASVMTQESYDELETYSSNRAYILTEDE